MPTRTRVFLAGDRRAILTQTALDALAADARVELVGVAFDRIDPVALRDARADVLISAAHPFMISRASRSLARLGAVGIHPSKLPRNRGSYPLWWALRRGYPDTALTLFHLVDEVDAGAVIDQRAVPIYRDDTFQTLYSRVALQVRPALAQLISTIEATGAVPDGRPQDAAVALIVRTPAKWQRALMRAYWHLRRRAFRAIRIQTDERPPSSI